MDPMDEIPVSKAARDERPRKRRPAKDGQDWQGALRTKDQTFFKSVIQAIVGRREDEALAGVVERDVGWRRWCLVAVRRQVCFAAASRAAKPEPVAARSVARGPLSTC